MGGRAEGLACADPGARTPIGASGNFMFLIVSTWTRVRVASDSKVLLTFAWLHVHSKDYSIAIIECPSKNSDTHELYYRLAG